MDFYEVLSDIMREKHMSIPDVAVACGLTDSTVRSIIARKQKRVSLDVAFKLKEGLGVSLERLNGEPVAAEASLVDERFAKISKNYNKLNERGKTALMEQSEVMASMPQYINDDLKNNSLSADTVEREEVG